MTTFTDNLTIKQIKQQAASIAETLAVPQFWLTDWLLYVIDKPSLFLMTDESYQLTDSESAKFNAGIKKMQQGIPLAYLTGHQAFWSLDFKVNAHTLIPRPDTEVLVEQVLEWIESNPIANHKASKRLLDLGTGSGCIAISLAHELARSSWQVIAVDLSAEALSAAQQNASDNQVDNVKFIQSSWYEALPSDAIQRFEVIVSNPPYIDEADEHLQGLKAEPISALSAPNKGLADIEHIVEQAPNYLQQGGLLAIEHGYDQGEAVRALFAANGFEAIKTAKDYGGNERVTLGQLK
ncbi:MAG: peptide chain release factor N(5)-glutamine methyltransferase [Psychrobacter sp.]